MNALSLNFQTLLFVITFAFFLSALCSSLMSKLGFKIALIDKPNERSSHSLPTPRGGGIGIWLSFLVAAGFFLQSLDYKYLTYIAGIVGLLGLIEDRYELSSKARLISQLIFSAIIVTIYSNIPLLTRYSSLPVNFLIFLFWIIFITGTTNFYNFMDGINGIAGLTGMVGFGLMAFFSHFVANKPDVALMSVVLSAGCLGFLTFNFPKAKVFMGDVGSVFLGFVFASFVVKLSTTVSIFLCLIMFLCTFYADAILTIFYRWRIGESLMKAHRSHLYQYLSNELKLPHWMVSILYAFSQLVIGLLAIWAYKKNVALQVVLMIVYGVLFIIVYSFIKTINPKNLRSV